MTTLFNDLFWTNTVELTEKLSWYVCVEQGSSYYNNVTICFFLLQSNLLRIANASIDEFDTKSVATTTATATVQATIVPIFINSLSIFTKNCVRHIKNLSTRFIFARSMTGVLYGMDEAISLWYSIQFAIIVVYKCGKIFHIPRRRPFFFHSLFVCN